MRENRSQGSERGQPGNWLSYLTILKKMKQILIVLILIGLSIGIHFASIYIYARLHATRQWGVNILSELILIFFLVGIWIRYFPNEKRELRILLGIIAFLLHWFTMPTY